MVTETRCPPRLGPEAFDQEAARPPRDAGFAGLFRSLIDDLRTLLRQELRLARAEITEKAAKAGRNAASLAVGGAVAFAGVLALIAAACTGLWAGLIVAGVSHTVAVWLAPLIVGAAMLLIGYGMIKKATATLGHMRVVPDKTTESLKETGRWMKDKVS